MSKADLEIRYRETVYSVFINKEQYDIKIGKPLPPFIQKLINKEKTAVILTAWNPKSQSLSLSDNHHRNSKLKELIKNYTIFYAVGQGVDSSWLAEESFFILGITKIEADKLAIEFEQFAYVWLERENTASLVFTNIWQ